MRAYKDIKIIRIPVNARNAKVFRMSLPGKDIVCLNYLQIFPVADFCICYGNEKILQQKATSSGKAATNAMAERRLKVFLLGLMPLCFPGKYPASNNAVRISFKKDEKNENQKEVTLLCNI